jgi:beta-glucosidase
MTEHGMATAGDDVRTASLEPSLRGPREVIDEGVPVLDYLHWTVMDNFEWIFGYDYQTAYTRWTTPPSPGPPGRVQRPPCR